jgi:hypothetical protein
MPAKTQSLTHSNSKKNMETNRTTPEILAAIKNRIRAVASTKERASPK